MPVFWPVRFSALLHGTDGDVVREGSLLFMRNAITFSCTGPEPVLEKVSQSAKLLGTVTSIANGPEDHRGFQIPV